MRNINQMQNILPAKNKSMSCIRIIAEEENNISN